MGTRAHLTLPFAALPQSLYNDWLVGQDQAKALVLQLCAFCKAARLWGLVSDKLYVHEIGREVSFYGVYVRFC
jgi:hypothetical protein